MLTISIALALIGSAALAVLSLAVLAVLAVLPVRAVRAPLPAVAADADAEIEITGSEPWIVLLPLLPRRVRRAYGLTGASAYGTAPAPLAVLAVAFPAPRAARAPSLAPARRAVRHASGMRCASPASSGAPSAPRGPPRSARAPPR